MWPVRSTPKRSPKLHCPWTGKTPGVTDAGVAGTGTTMLSAARAYAVSPRDVTASRAVYAPAGSAVVAQESETTPDFGTRPSLARTGAAPARSRSTRACRPGVARNANTTFAPGATVDGVVVKLRAVGSTPAEAPPVEAA